MGTIKRKSSCWLFLLLVTMSIVSCNQHVEFDQYVTIPKDGWSMDSMAVFKVDVLEQEKIYNIYLNIRNRSDYPNSNLWLFVDVISPSGKAMHQKVDCVLADEAGKWLGSGWGDLFHVKVALMRDVKFAEEGVYMFRIVHGMRKEDLEGIHNIGLRLEEAKLPEIE